MSDTTPLRCHCRRHAETGLRCARCNVPICPDCSVPFAVGMICRDCARANRSPLYQVKAGSLMLGYAVSFAVAIPAGWLLQSMLGFGFFMLWGAFLYGLLVAEVALRVTGRKRGLQMEIMAGAASLGGLLAGWLLIGKPLALLAGWPVLILVVAFAAALGRIRNIG